MFKHQKYIGNTSFMITDKRQDSAIPELQLSHQKFAQVLSAQAQRM